MTKTTILSVAWTTLVYTVIAAIIFTGFGAIGYGVVGAFWSGAPGDFPWEDILSPQLAEIMYQISHGFESLRDFLLG